MTALRIFLITAVLLTTSHAAASGDVYTGLNVYKPTVSKWNTAIQQVNFDSVSWIWNLEKPDKKHKNGNRDTILMVPNSAIPDDITLVVWFHGLGGFNKKTFSKRILPQVENVVDNGNSVAIAIPEMPWSINTTTPRKRQGQVWKKSGELERYVDSLKEHLEIWALIKHGSTLGSVRIIFVGHSAGGSAIMSASKEAGLCRLKPEAVVFSDASYGYWLDKTWSSCVKDLDTKLHVLVRKWDKPHKNAERVYKKYKRAHPQSKLKVDLRYQVLDRRKWTHSKIGNSVFKLTDLFPPGC